MKEKIGQVYSIANDNPSVPGCTVSKSVQSDPFDIIYFSLAKNTDISAELYPYHKFLVVSSGSMEVYGKEEDGRTYAFELQTGDCILTKLQIPVGIRTNESAVYTEISIRRDSNMNEVIKAGEVFELGKLLPYQEGKIVNMDVASNDKMKFVLMSFDAGTGLSEHAAPGEAMIFALDGEGIIGYEGKEYPIKAGENFHFAKGGMHMVKAEKQFKMALLLTLD